MAKETYKTCPKCHKDIHAKNYDAHLRSRTAKGHENFPPEPSPYRCEECDKDFAQSSNHIKHMLNKHGIVVEKMEKRERSKTSSESGKMTTPVKRTKDTGDLTRAAKKTKVQTDVDTVPSTQEPPDKTNAPADGLSQQEFSPTQKHQEKEKDNRPPLSEDEGGEHDNDDERTVVCEGDADGDQTSDAPEIILPTIYNLVPYHEDSTALRSAYASAPAFFKRFLTGKLGTENIDLQDVIEFLTTDAWEIFGYFVPCMFLVELDFKILSTNDLLHFYEMTLKKPLLPPFSQLHKSITVQQCQQHLSLLSATGKLPFDLKLLVDHEPMVREFWTRCKQPTDVAHITTNLQQIVRDEDSRIEGLPNKVEMKQVKRIYNSTLVKNVLDSISTDAFNSIFDTMMRQSMQLDYGNISVYLKAFTASGAVLEIRLFDFVAAKHGIERSDKIKTVQISASGKEYQIIMDLLCTDNARSNYKGKLNYSVYEMAKKMGVQDLKTFLIGSEKLEAFATTLKLKKDMVIISVSEKLQDLFESNQDLSQWLSPEDQLHFLDRFDKEEVLWLLKQRNIPFSNELAVYIALVSWAYSENNSSLISTDQIKLCKDEKIITSFREVYPECLCILDLEQHYGSLFVDDFVDHSTMAGAIAHLRDKTSAPQHCSIRHRQP